MMPWFGRVFFSIMKMAHKYLIEKKENLEHESNAKSDGTIDAVFGHCEPPLEILSTQ